MATPFANTPIFPTAAAALVPSDTAEFRPGVVYVGGAGTVVCRPHDNTSDVTFTGLAAGSVVPVVVTAVRATGTTATALVVIR